MAERDSHKQRQGGARRARPKAVDRVSKADTGGRRNEGKTGASRRSGKADSGRGSKSGKSSADSTRRSSAGGGGRRTKRGGGTGEAKSADQRGAQRGSSGRRGAGRSEPKARRGEARRGSGGARRRTDAAGRPGSGSTGRPGSTELPDPAEVLDKRVVREVESSAGPKARSALAHLAASTIAYEEGSYEVAVREAASAKRLAPRAAVIRETLGIALYASGDWMRAISELRTFGRLSGSRSQYPVVADCLRAMGRPAKALELLDEMKSDSDPEPLRIEAELVRAGVLQDEGKIREAIGALRSVLRDPENVEIHHLRLWYLLADLFESAGRPAEAKTLFSKIADHDSEFLDAVERARNG